MSHIERANSGLHAHVAARLMEYLPDKSSRILDVGCGTGAFLVRLKNHGYGNLTGLDIGPPADLPGITFIQTDLDSSCTTLETGSIDMAISIEVVEHIENIGLFLTELSRLIKKGGYLLLTTPNLHSVEAKARFLMSGKLKQFDAIGDPTHVTPILQFPFQRTLSRHGFSTLKTWGFPEDGTSFTSRPGLRLLAQLLRAFGARGRPDGDQLCMLLEKTADTSFEEDDNDKRRKLTEHYSK